jgi:hypothetical protein
MTSRNYGLISLKSIFGGGAKLKVSEWERLHRETRELCDGLSLELIKDREAFTIVVLFRGVMDITAENPIDQEKIRSWIAALDERINETKTEP